MNKIKYGVQYLLKGTHYSSEKPKILLITNIHYNTLLKLLFLIELQLS